MKQIMKSQDERMKVFDFISNRVGFLGVFLINEDLEHMHGRLKCDFGNKVLHKFSFT